MHGIHHRLLRLPPDVAFFQGQFAVQKNTSDTMPQHVLLVEDSSTLSLTYQRYLSQAGFEVVAAPSGSEALAALEHRPAVVALDLGLPDMDGLELLHEIQSRDQPPSVIIITGNASLSTAVAAMRAGAFDYLVKPFNAERLVTTVRNAIERNALQKEVQVYRKELKREQFHGFIGSSLEMLAVYKTIESAARSNATVFITGESGTGKEVCANAIHMASARARKPFIAINCAAIPRDLMESEIFGHVAGAFTGALSDRSGAAELADGGTLFLDEICEMDINLQAKLLRLLQSGTFQRVGSGKVMKADIRVVCATNRDPLAEVDAGRFREDLYYRLHVIPVHLPALRERGDDIRLIANALLERFTKSEGKKFTQLSDDALETIARHDWPGNVRELQNAIHNAVVLHDGEVLEAAMLPDWVRAGRRMRANAAETGGVFTPAPLPRPGEAIMPLWQIEKQAILAAIEACGGNVLKAAAFLEIAVSTIYRKKTEWAKNG
jgi:two-component system repressor protein LuxO